MKKEKYFILFIILITFLLPNITYSKIKFGIGLTGGYSYIANSDFNDFVEGGVNQTVDEIKSQNIASYEVSFDKINGALNGEIEFRIIPISQFMIGLGAGYINLPDSIFIRRCDDPSQGSDDFEMKFIGKSAVPLLISEYYIIEVGSLNLNIGAGIEYYSGSLSVENTKNVENGVSKPRENSVEFSGSGIGINLKLESQYKLSDNFSLIAGVRGRFGEISGFEGDVKQEDGTTKKTTLYSYDKKVDNKTYHTWEPLTENEKADRRHDPNVSNLKEASIILTGVNIYLGIGITF